ncbi:MAG TPA: helix-turn-helix domain-containing protein [Polyangiaceae bacterium]|nr:helix-turn-helix domain-containing protein [Polyangiaceae bacterium]
MPGRENAVTEIVNHRRSVALPGIEVIEAQRSPREWRVIPDCYSVVVFRTWQGRARTRGQTHLGAPGLAFCNVPGELLIGTPFGSGSFNVMQIRSELLGEWLAEQQRSSVRPDWAAIMKPLSAELRLHFANFFELFRPTVSAMQLQSQLVELSEAIVGELIQGARQPGSRAAASSRGAARMRECLNEEGLNVDLDTLAQRAGLSRFHALRAFKQRYGLPPHAYQLCLRMNHAKRLLLDGVPAADVALRCGFADQSHFNRHFKRFTAVTPTQYAGLRRCGTHSKRAEHDERAEQLVERSDR